MKSPRRQRGQSMVFVVLTLAVVLASGLMLFNSGMLATKKMQVQNAADAAAYSIALLEARDLNFMAYTNRAMVANEVGIGQLVGLASWAVHMESTPKFLDYWTRLYGLQAVPYLGTFIAVLIRVMRGVGSAVKGAVFAVVPPFTRALGFMSRAYSASQYAMHLATLGMSWGVYRAMIEANAPGARPSTYGTMALLAHQGSFTSSYLVRYSQARRDDRHLAGMERLAQVIQDSRDAFSVGRECGWSGICDRKRGWDAPLVPRIGMNNIYSVQIGDDTYYFGVRFHFELALRRRGGTELRPISGDGLQQYAWSGADATAMTMSFAFRICFFRCWGRGPTSVGQPFGLGAARVGPARPRDMRGAAVQNDRYGLAPANAPDGVSRSVWEWPDFISPSIGTHTRRNDMLTSYRGLQDYFGVAPERDYYGMGFMAPYLIVGVVMDDERVPRPDTRGRLEMPRQLAGPDGGQLAAIAKARVSFQRPGDLDYFRRADGREEIANAFNPYWSAHLVDTQFADRVMALAVQQEERWYPDITLPDIPGVDYDSIASSLGLR